MKCVVQGTNTGAVRTLCVSIGVELSGPLPSSPSLCKGWYRRTRKLRPPVSPALLSGLIALLEQDTRRRIWLTLGLVKAATTPLTLLPATLPILIHHLIPRVSRTRRIPVE